MSDGTQQQGKVDCYHLPYGNYGFSEILLFWGFSSRLCHSCVVCCKLCCSASTDCPQKETWALFRLFVAEFWLRGGAQPVLQALLVP